MLSQKNKKQKEKGSNLTVLHGVKCKPIICLAILLLWIYPRELKACQHRNLYTNAPNSIIYNSQTLETTQMSTNGWMNKMWYIRAMEYHWAIGGNEGLIHVTTWMNRVHTPLSEWSLTKNAIYVVRFYLQEASRMDQSVETSIGLRGAGSSCVTDVTSAAGVTATSWSQTRAMAAQWGRHLMPLNCTL